MKVPSFLVTGGSRFELDEDILSSLHAAGWEAQTRSRSWMCSEGRSLLVSALTAPEFSHVDRAGRSTLSIRPRAKTDGPPERAPKIFKPGPATHRKVPLPPRETHRTKSALVRQMEQNNVDQQMEEAPPSIKQAAPIAPPSKQAAPVAPKQEAPTATTAPPSVRKTVITCSHVWASREQLRQSQLCTLCQQMIPRQRIMQSCSLCTVQACLACSASS